MTDEPKPLKVVWSVVRSLATVAAPAPSGSGTSDYGLLHDPLSAIADGGTEALGHLEGKLAEFLLEQSRVVPDQLSRDEALAYWINLYNAGALVLAGRAVRKGEDSVLGIPGGFQSNIVSIGGEALSLDDIEHAKLRRFRDPRIHAALVCGSVSCPSLRREPYSGAGLGGELDGQIRYFLSAGACVPDPSVNNVRLSRVFLWFGGDFVRPGRMPTFLPARRSAILASITPWLDSDIGAWIEKKEPDVGFLPYDWSLRCVVR